MKVAIIDCGTNTVRLFLGVGTSDRVTEVSRDLRFARLGQGVDATGRFHQDALERTFAIVDEYARMIADFGADKVRFVATSAARDVENREEFFEGVHSLLGVYPDVISGQEEAELSFLGALAGGSDWEVEPEAPVLVMDIGGGSTELIRGTASGRIESAVSLDMGAVRLTERYLLGDPPTQDQILAAESFVRGLIDDCCVDLSGLSVFLGVGCTATSLAAMSLRLRQYDGSRVHNSSTASSVIEGLSRVLLGLTVEETVARYPSLQPQRAEVIAGGAMICAEVSRRIDCSLIARETDILDGAALKLMRT